MKTRFFYWLKREVGFSRKESKGFLLVIPILAILALSPNLLNFFSGKRSSEFDQQTIRLADSLYKAGFRKATSPFPIQVSRDTTIRTNSGLKKIPLSEADSITLQIVPGIGPALSGRIIKYELALGGFYSKFQIKEIYGIAPEVADRLWDYFEFDGEIKKRIPINSASVEDLAGHPYISYGQSKVIIAYRNQHGPFTESNDLLKIRIFEPEWIEKIAPYLAF